MENTCLLSEASRYYLCRYYQLLDEMVHSVNTARLTQNISHNFIVQTIPLQRAAADMCQNLLDTDGGNRAVRTLAQTILLRQGQSAADLEQTLTACTQPTECQRDLQLYQRRANLILRDTAVRMGSAPEGSRLGAVFLEQILPCHRGAVQMARSALRYGVCSELTPILYTIIRQRCQELARIQDLRQQSQCQGDA